MVAFVVSLALALVSHTGQHQARATGHFPTRGRRRPRRQRSPASSSATPSSRFRPCGATTTPSAGTARTTTWLYEYRGAEPLGAAVRFQKNKLVAVFSLGSPAGWKTDKGLYMGDPIANVYQYYPTTGTTRCIGFDAITAKTGKSVTAFYSAAGVVYGFAMVIPTMTVCQ